jgi:hypothetical protein
MRTSRALACSLPLLLLLMSAPVLANDPMRVKRDAAGRATGYFLVARESADSLLARPAALQSKILNARARWWHGPSERLFIPSGITFYLFAECDGVLRLQPRQSVTEFDGEVSLICL